MRKMTTTSTNAVGDSHTFQLLRHPVFRAEVNRLANAKCRDAVKAGIFKYVPQRHHKAPSWYTPRYVPLHFEHGLLIAELLF